MEECQICGKQGLSGLLVSRYAYIRLFFEYSMKTLKMKSKASRKIDLLFILSKVEIFY